jgi:signal-transduction protein with cAMP-binding, CBS, and nucleotidyltransferase domain
MRVRDMSSTGLVWTVPEESLREAALRLVGEEVGALTVAEGGRLMGIFSERDLVQAVADRVDLDQALVRDYMTVGAIEVEQDAPAAYAAWQMKSNGVRHVVVTRDGEPGGMISARDLLRSFD